jgi:hypothetical protein
VIVGEMLIERTGTYWLLEDRQALECSFAPLSMSTWDFL